MNVSPNFDPLLAKVIVTASSRDEAISRFLQALNQVKVLGPPNNVPYLKAIAQNDTFIGGKATTKFLDTFSFRPQCVFIMIA